MKELLNKIHHADCLSFMRELPDKCVDLVLTDPPYGIGINGSKLGGKSPDKTGKLYDANSWDIKEWDLTTPDQSVFDEIKRISKQQIIFGYNYFPEKVGASKGLIIWDKKEKVPSNNYSDAEIASCSFGNAKIYRHMWSGLCKDSEVCEKTIHPTQKPVQLFKWCLSYAKLEKGIVLDCFSGSGTTALACHDLDLDFICVEKDADYHAASVKRLEEHQRQLRLL